MSCLCACDLLVLRLRVVMQLMLLLSADTTTTDPATGMTVPSLSADKAYVASKLADNLELYVDTNPNITDPSVYDLMIYGLRYNAVSGVPFSADYFIETYVYGSMEAYNETTETLTNFLVVQC